MEDKNRNEMKTAVVEALAEAMIDWLPVDATTDDVAHIIAAFALEMSVRTASTAEHAVDLVRELSVTLAKLTVEKAQEIRDIFEEVAAANEGDSIALPESEDR